VVLKLGSSTETEDPNPKAKAKATPKKRGALDRMARQAAESEDEDVDDGAVGEGRAGRREAQKQQKKQEKKEAAAANREHREEMEREREEESSKKTDKYSQKQKAKEEERLAREEAERKEREEKEKKEQAEFDDWKNMFSVEAEGEDNSDQADAGAVEKFVDYIKVRKVVNLEDLAADFKMKTSVAIDRLKDLEKLGRLSGIFDDRGKYVYITTEEMAGVAEWLKNKGRISRADLVAACNKIVRLNPTEEDKARLQHEASSAVDALDDAEAPQES